MRYVLHTFRPGETIDAVFRLLGRHNLTRPELDVLARDFNELNGAVLARPGMTFKIPLPRETTDDFGNVVQIPETKQPA